MRRLTDTDGLTEFQRDILRTVRDFVDAEVLPVASELDHADVYPDGIVTRLKELGVFGLTIDEQYGGLGESLLTYALVVEELARGWMSLSGIINTHFIVAYLIAAHGTQEQQDFFLPKMATGEVRSALSMSEPDLGSDVAAIRTATGATATITSSAARRCGLPTAPRPAWSRCSPAPRRTLASRTATSPRS
jgi:alkylation response protein AidB-like acyl-CoA dehydrogenase